jgi:diguanylate cyclase (GGDEF)-like protein
MTASQDSGSGGPAPDALANRLEQSADRLTAHLDESVDPALAGAILDHAEELVRMATALRSLALEFDANRIEALTRREEEVKAIALTISESIRGLAEVHRLFNEQMGDEIHELDTLAELPAGEELANRLRRALVHVGQATRALDQQVKAAATSVGMANLRIATLERELDEARDRALHDGLTRLYSRTALDERLAAAIARGITEGPWCFFMGDMDLFKRINDRFGHVVGDGLLAQVARFLEESVRKHDEIGFIARYGGEEFGVILPRTNLAQAARVAERIRAAMGAARWNVGNGEAKQVVQITISIGVAEYRPGDTPEMLIQRADEALYRAKHSGRDRVVLAEE